jgi:hypothetical protein
VLELNTPISTISEMHSSSSVHHCLTINPIFPTSYWDSPEAGILFSAKDGDRTQQSIKKQIEILQNANRTEETYLVVRRRNGSKYPNQPYKASDQNQEPVVVYISALGFGEYEWVTEWVDLEQVLHRSNNNQQKNWASAQSIM